MWRILSIALISVFAFVFSMDVKAQDSSTTTEVTTTTAPITTSVSPTERHVIITEVPAPKVVTTAPVNYINCFKVEAGWHGEVWVPEHRICQYENSPEGEAWVEGYWTCTQFKVDTGDCTAWDWKDAHWVKVLDVY